MKLFLGAVGTTLALVAAGNVHAQAGASRAYQENTQYGALLDRSARDAAADAAAARQLHKEMNANRRIVNGTAVALGTYPWIVAIGYFDNNVFFQYCAGSVIDSRWVLTAAHCHVQEGDGVVVGVIDISRVTAPTATVLKVVGPTYDKTTRTMDFALLSLNAPLRVQTIGLSRESAFEVTKGNTFVIAGWGRTSFGGSTSDVLLDTPISTMATDKCARQYSVVPLSLTNTMFCGSADRGDACQGDSGGPAMREVRPKQYVLVGLVSWGKDCGQSAFPGVYTRASQIADLVDGYLRPAAPPTPPAPPPRAPARTPQRPGLSGSAPPAVPPASAGAHHGT